MSDVEVYQPQGLSPVGANELDVMVRQADMLAQSSIIPKDYRKQPANILVAAMTGRTFGWDVMTAMRNGHVIEGTWSIKPEAMLALVRRAGHSVTGETGPQGATVRGKRGDTGDEMTVTFTMEDAKRANLATKNTWRQYPQSMCWARAVSQLCRMLFADVTLGLSYTPEELGAEVDADGAVIDPRPSGFGSPGGEVPSGGPYVISPQNAEALRQRCAERGLNVAQVVTLGTGGRVDDPDQVTTDEIKAIKDAMDEVEAAAEMVGAETEEDIADAEVIAGGQPGEYAPGEEPFE